MPTYAAQTSEITVGNGVTASVVHVVAAAKHPIRISEIDISIKGAAATEEKGLVEAGFTDGAGTFSSLVAVPLNKDQTDDPDSTAEHTATVEPAYSGIVFRELIHNQGGYTWRPPAPIIVPASTGFAIRFTNNHSTSRNVTARLCFEE